MDNFPLRELHQQWAPKKFLPNFWKSVDYHAANSILTQQGKVAVVYGDKARKGAPSTTSLHPTMALAFMRWADPEKFYERMTLLVEKVG